MKDVAIGLLWGLLAVAAAGGAAGLVHVARILLAGRRWRKRMRAQHFADKARARDWRNEWKP